MYKSQIFYSTYDLKGGIIGRYDFSSFHVLKKLES
jgi:hypothetical protein